MLIVGFVLLFIHLVLLINSLRGSSRISFLKKYFNEKLKEPVKVSIIFAARNEEKNIEKAVLHLLNQNYPFFEVIAVNDRSTDKTAAILDKLASNEARMKVIHIDTLPQAWLGKNHAMHVGTQHASGEWLLFTDADVIMHPKTLHAAIVYSIKHHLDFLSLTAQITSPSCVVRLLVGFLYYCLGTVLQPWLIQQSNSYPGLGAGAFMLARKKTYKMIGGHESVRLRPDEDIRLGQHFKKMGAQCDVVYGLEGVKVDWYEDFLDMQKGLEKNVFAASGYSLLLIALGFFGGLVFYVFPWLGMFFFKGYIHNVCIAICITMAINALCLRKYYGQDFLSALVLPLSFLLVQFILLRSVFLTLYRGGIYWRDTFYSLKELKSFHA